MSATEEILASSATPDYSAGYEEGFHAGRQAAAARVDELLETNNRYLEDAREANRRLRILDTAQRLLIEGGLRADPPFRLNETHTLTLRVDNALCFDMVHALGGDASAIGTRLLTPLLLGQAPGVFEDVGLRAFGIVIEDITPAVPKSPPAKMREEEELQAMGARYETDEDRWYHPAHRQQWLNESPAEYLGWIKGYDIGQEHAKISPAEEIVRAAMSHQGVVYDVPQPGRHCNVIRMISDLGKCSPDNPVVDDGGFLTSTGRYVDRQEAWKIAEAAGQLLERAPTDKRGGALYSEDVW